jgi:hypothetical protein
MFSMDSWILIFDTDQEQIYNAMKWQLMNCLFNPPCLPLKRRVEKPAHLLSKLFLCEGTRVI